MGLIHTIEEALVDLVRATYSTIGWPGVGLLMAIESTAIPMPSEIILTFAGWQLVLERGGGFGLILFGALVGTIGSIAGALAQYGVARWLGEPFIRRYGKWVLLTQDDLERVTKWFNRYGIVTVLALRMVPGVRGLVSIPAGIARVNVLLFATLVAIAAFPWALLLVWLGYLLGDNYEAVSAFLQPFYIPIFAAGALLIALFLFRRIRTIRREGRALS